MNHSNDTLRSSACSSDAATRRIADAVGDLLRAWVGAGTQAAAGTARVAADLIENLGDPCCPAGTTRASRETRDKPPPASRA